LGKNAGNAHQKMATQQKKSKIEKKLVVQVDVTGRKLLGGEKKRDESRVLVVPYNESRGVLGVKKNFLNPGVGSKKGGKKPLGLSTEPRTGGKWNHGGAGAGDWGKSRSLFTPRRNGGESSQRGVGKRSAKGDPWGGKGK